MQFIYKNLIFLALLVIVLFCNTSSVFGDSMSYLSDKDIEMFVHENLDLSSFRNSLGPRRTFDKRTFKALGLSPSHFGKGVLRYDGEDWLYQIEIKSRKDFNRDGVEDLALCFIDKAKKGSYSTKKSLLVTRYSSHEMLIAIDYEIEACE